MANNKRILFISQEIAPYIPSGDAAQLGRNLPQGMQERGFEVRTFMPKFGSVNERRNQLHEVIRLSGINIMIDDNDHPLIIKVASLQPSRIQVYFIDNDDYFQKLDEDEDYAGSNRADNDERAILFTRGTLETAKKLRWDPKIIMSSGWITSLIPMYLKKVYNDDLSFKSSKIVHMIMPEKLSAPIDARFLAKLKADGVSSREIKKYADQPLDTNLLHKMAIDYSHAVILNDPNPDTALVEYIAQSGKPCLTHDRISGIDSFSDFLNSL